jgi:sterol desaturase/sphingolipid hydroxylase (fatty acid hydroxylase superfamily)
VLAPSLLQVWLQQALKLLLMFGPFKTLVLAAAIFIPFERLAAADRTQRILRRGWATDLCTGLINGLLLSGAVLMLLGIVETTANAVMPNARGWVASNPFWVQAVVAVIIGDLGIYLMHRLAHTLPWLWRVHAVHHSAEELDWLIAFRFHPLDQLLMRVASLAPLVALNISPTAITVFVVVFAWQSWLVHANVRISYGPLRWAIVSPEFHHLHHSAERESFNQNYASIFAVWDLLFGTGHLLPARYPLRYGTTEPVAAGYVARFYQPFRRIRLAELPLCPRSGSPSAEARLGGAVEH